MDTLTQPRPDLHFDMTQSHTSASAWAAPIGRLFFSLIFLMSGLNHFTSGSVSYAANQGVPFANILVPLSGVLAIVGGLSVLFGYHAKVGALILLLFLVPVTVLMHNFWTISDPEMYQMQMVHFLKNLALIGGAIMIAFHGAGPISIDNRITRTKV